VQERDPLATCMGPPSESSSTRQQHGGNRERNWGRRTWFIQTPKPAPSSPAPSMRAGRGRAWGAAPPWPSQTRPEVPASPGPPRHGCSMLRLHSQSGSKGCSFVASKERAAADPGCPAPGRCSHSSTLSPSFVQIRPGTLLCAKFCCPCTTRCCNLLTRAQQVEPWHDVAGVLRAGGGRAGRQGGVHAPDCLACSTRRPHASTA